MTKRGSKAAERRGEVAKRGGETAEGRGKAAKVSES